MTEKQAAEFHEPRRSWCSADDDTQMRSYMGMHGRISVASLLAHMATIAPGVAPERMMLNWSTIVWESESTEPERAARAVGRARQAAATEKWERDTLVRLTEKYGSAPSGESDAGE